MEIRQGAHEWDRVGKNLAGRDPHRLRQLLSLALQKPIALLSLPVWYLTGRSLMHAHPTRFRRVLALALAAELDVAGTSLGDSAVIHGVLMAMAVGTETRC